MTTKTERLLEKVKDCDWEYAIARHIPLREFTVRDNMDEQLGDVFIGHVTSKDPRDRFSLEYTAPVHKMMNENGRLKRVDIDYGNAEWKIVPRVKRGKGGNGKNE